MSDKRKKVFLTKEFTSPKRPIILKSDREVPKEPPKEKEKQPTIILKNREQSTPREDRPISPRASTSEPDTPQPCKIAQNENKEKKIIESRPSAPIKQMTEPVKLLDENLEFNNAALEFLNDASTSYLIVSIVGNQSVGKSTILNLLALNSPVQDICQRILVSHEIDDDEIEGNGKSVEEQMENLNINPRVKKDKDDVFKFRVQDIEHIERGLHCTRGIDMYVTEDRVILLDCQALWSPSLIDEVSSTNTITSRSANVITVDCIQMTSFLMAVSHVFIAVQDWFTDYNFLRYIQAAEMLLPSLSTSSSSVQDGLESTNGGENRAHLLLLHNRCQLEDYTVDSVKTMQEFYKKIFMKSNLQLDSGMYMYSDTNKNGLQVDSVCKNYSVEACGTPINMFLLPEVYEDYDNKEIFRGHPPFEELAKRLRWMILGANKHQITNIPNLSEKGWFQYCNKAWETIRKCTFFMEYERFLP